MKFGIVGTGKMAYDALAIASESPGLSVELAIGDPSMESAQSKVSKMCDRLGVPYFSTENLDDRYVASLIKKYDLDYLLSANNFFVFKQASLAAPKMGIINFHNGPLPRYRGLNSCSWALFNGEPKHGVTWHLIDQGIDSGPVLSQAEFEVEANATAISLISKCILTGLELLPDLLRAATERRLRPVAQNSDDALYYKAKDKPWEGRVPWWLGITEIERLERMLSFSPLPNLFYRPSIVACDGTTAFAERIEAIGEETPSDSGAITGCGDNYIEIATRGGVIRLTDLFDEADNPLAPDTLESFAVGSALKYAD